MISTSAITEAITSFLPSSKLIYLFGSQANETATSQSDVDLAILLPRKLDPVERFDLQEKLARQFRQDVDLVDLLSASTVLQHQVVQSGKLLWGVEDDQAKFEMQVLSMYQHLNEERSEILKQYQS
ncbi:type VII toxin-antitoxin system MntA family adenylyltransferase antitoxin [Echinimonas agarilytica]|uniref:Nucleotidyltransferase domain-containing protein n=1 Tax=Echinimonas agarilytica TaxID=1215918 RepID=A0AA41W929_9GAMM|nr:nucleotidyltransferase domain-containing protein [Echinimonas agarilytica]